MPKHTPEQVAALQTDKHLSLTANAGSGKTSVLIERYSNLLTEMQNGKRIEPKDIVAITFTNKAASEMESRAVLKIEDRLQTADSSDYKRLLELRNKMCASRISTFHSFCIELLRDFPIEAGVLPSFTIISSAEMQKINEDSINEILADTLESFDENGEPTQERLELLELINIYGKKKLRNILSSIIQNREKLLYLSKSYNDNISIQTKIINDLTIRDIVSKINKLIKSSLDFLEISSEIDKISKLSLDCSALLKTAYIAPEQQNISYDDVQVSIEKVYEFKNELLNKGWDYNKKKFPKDEDFIKRILPINSIMIDLGKKVSEFYDVIDNRIYLEKTLKLADIIYRLAQRAISVVEEQKYEMGGITFDDAQIKTLNLLKDHEEVRTKVQNEIKYLMVDEFQDTNQLQYELIKTLIGDYESHINLYIVGDPKQSIYGFRSADVRVFETATKDIINANAKYIYSSDEKELGRLPLSATFRLAPAISAFVNHTCSDIIGRNETPFDVPYQDLVTAKYLDSIELDKNRNEYFLNENAGKVEALFSIKYKKEEDFEKNPNNNDAPEEDLLAKKILLMVSGKDGEIRDSKSEKFRKPEFGDIAVISRTRTHWKSLMEIFRNYNIPFAAFGGKGFFQNAETLDLIVFLKFLSNKSDDLSLASSLKSPFFRLNDNDIYHIFNLKGASLFAKLISFSPKSALDANIQSSKIEFAKNIILDLIEISNEVSFSILIRKIDEFTAYLASQRNKSDFAQIEANFEKIIAYAQSYEDSSEFPTLFELVEDLDFLKDTDKDEGDADIGVAENAVKIITMHSSKGLEFPIVFLYNLNAKPKADIYSELEIDKDYGFYLKAPILKEKGLYEFEEHPFYLFAASNASALNSEEMKRLYYVAATRAKERLILSAGFTKIKEFSSALGFFKIINNSLIPNYKETLQYFEESAEALEKLVIKTNLKTYRLDEHEEPRYDEFPISFGVDVINNISLANVHIANETNEAKSNEKHPIFLDFKPLKLNERYSASQIMTFENDKNEFFERSRLGLPDLEQYKEINKALTKTFLKTEIGVITHYAMERLNSWLDTDTCSITDELGKTLDTKIEEFNYSADEKLKAKNQIIALIKNLVASDLFKINKNKFKTAQFEISLNLPIDKHFLIGQIDMLIENEIGDKEIWDWKTNKIRSEQEFHDQSHKYQSQMESYLIFLYKLYPNLTTYKAKLLFLDRAFLNDDKLWISELSKTTDEMQLLLENYKNKFQNIEISAFEALSI